MARNTDDHSQETAETFMAAADFGFVEEEVKLHKDESNLNHNFAHLHSLASPSAVKFADKRAKSLHSSPCQDKGKGPKIFPQAVAGRTRSHFEKDEDTEDRVDEGVSNSSQFDIASTANAEVKVSLICNSSGNSYFRQQSLDAVIGEVEDECRITYGIQNPDFSLVQLMEKVCQFFLEMDKSSSIDTGRKNCDTFKESEGKDGVKDDNQGNSGLKHSKILQDPQLSDSQLEAVLQKKYPIYLKDISRGEDNIPIPLVIENSTLELPDFIYIKNNMVYQKGHIDFSLARISEDSCCPQCLGDCLSSALPCACAAETGGVFAYTQEGLLKEEFLDEAMAVSLDPQRKHFYHCEVCPLQNDLKVQQYGKVKRCKGHLTRKFIKECWSKCGCNKKCGNRVVQRGIQVALQVFSAPEGKGWGVRSVNALKKGTFICEYVGEIVTNQELYERNNERAAQKERHTYPVLLDADWGSERILEDEEALCLDATEFGNVGRFINHRCYDCNLIEVPVEVETPDHHYYRLAFFTTRDIEPMEELTWDYGIEFDDKYHPIKAFKCKCGSMRCRDKKRRHCMIY